MAGPLDAVVDWLRGMNAIPPWALPGHGTARDPARSLHGREFQTEHLRDIEKERPAQWELGRRESSNVEDQRPVDIDEQIENLEALLKSSDIRPMQKALLEAELTNARRWKMQRQK